MTVKMKQKGYRLQCYDVVENSRDDLNEMEPIYEKWAEKYDNLQKQSPGGVL